MRRRSIAAVFVAALLVFSARAQQHPNQEKGFEPTKLYHFADIDSINTFNGNLIVTLPLTQTFRVGPLMAYAFTPVYNANVWDAQERAAMPDSDGSSHWAGSFRPAIRRTTVSTPTRVFCTRPPTAGIIHSTRSWDRSLIRTTRSPPTKACFG